MSAQQRPLPLLIFGTVLIYINFNPVNSKALPSNPDISDDLLAVCTSCIELYHSPYEETRTSCVQQCSGR